MPLGDRSNQPCSNSIFYIKAPGLTEKLYAEPARAALVEDHLSCDPAGKFGFCGPSLTISIIHMLIMYIFARLRRRADKPVSL
jgi:hypothetical protein